MNHQHHISLQEEFDEHDGVESKYIVLLDYTYLVATCRFYELNADCACLVVWLFFPNIAENTSVQKLLMKRKVDCRTWQYRNIHRRKIRSDRLL